MSHTLELHTVLGALGMRAMALWIAKVGLCNLLLTSAAVVKAEEFAFSSYGLGGAGFNAGVTPPPGTYVTFIGGFYAGDIKGNITIGGVLFTAGARVEFFQAALNGLYVPERKVLGGHLGLSVTVPVGHIDLETGVTAGSVLAMRQTDGWGLGDVLSPANWTIQCEKIGV